MGTLRSKYKEMGMKKASAFWAFLAILVVSCNNPAGENPPPPLNELIPNSLAENGMT
jgi:hypothetical protein